MTLKKIDGFDAEQIIVLPHYQLNELSAHPIISDLYITDIGYFPRANHHYRERPSGCDSHIIMYCANGEGWVQMGTDEKFLLSKQSLAYIPADMPHSYGADESNPWSIYWLHLRGQQVETLMQSIGLEACPLQLTLSDAEKFIELFRQCYDLLSDKAYSLSHQLHVSHTVRYLLSFISLSDRSKQTEKTDAYIEQAVHHMQELLHANLTLEELAVYTRLSKQHLNHLFKQATGYAPIDYYLRLKIQRAGQLLDLTNQSVKEISISLGFKDPYYFSRLFKKIIGLAPTEYRNHLKG